MLLPGDTEAEIGLSFIFVQKTSQTRRFLYWSM
jgi:hypothetical protein